ncbi:MAG: transposase [cyanobacterium endosymbiont of Rhopalodia sterrenbergii]
MVKLINKFLLSQRSLIETVNDKIKNISYIMHARRQNICNYFVNLLTLLMTYTH